MLLLAQITELSCIQNAQTTTTPLSLLPTTTASQSTSTLFLRVTLLLLPSCRGPLRLVFTVPVLLITIPVLVLKVPVLVLTMLLLVLAVLVLVLRIIREKLKFTLIFLLSTYRKSHTLSQNVIPECNCYTTLQQGSIFTCTLCVHCSKRSI